MKKQSLLFCVTLMMLFGFTSKAQTVTISSGLSSDTVCSGGTIDFTATPGATGSFGYIWNLNGSYVGTSSAVYSTATLPAGVNMIYCLLTNAAGDTIYSVSDTLTITVNSLPSNLPITSPTTPAAVCVGDTLNLTDDASGGVWVSADPTSAPVSSIGTVTGLAVPVGGGGPGGPSVRIYYILTNSCGSDSVNIRVRIAAPASAIAITSTTICIDSSVTVSDATGGGNWVSSDSTIAGVGINFVFGMPPTISEQVTGVTAGTVTITYSGMNACGPYTETTDITVVDCSTAVKNVASIADGCNVYPNPSTGVLSILAKSSKYAQANCTITNMVGAHVKDAVIRTNQEATLDLNVPTGVYFMTISAGTETYTTKVVIME